MRGDETALLYQISRQLNSDLDINRVLADALHLTVEHTGAVNGSIIVFDEAGSVAHRILARVGMPPEKEEAVIAEVLKQGLAGWVVDHRQGGVVESVVADKRWISFPDDELQEGSAVSVPLLRDERVIGVITLRHPEVGYYTQAHLELLLAIADQASIAVENARLFHSVQTERAKMAAIINGAGELILVTDAEGRVVMMNALAHRALDAAGEGAGQKTLVEWMPQAALAELWVHREDAAYPKTAELSLKEGRTFLASLTSVPTVGYIVMMQDVTDLKELNQMKTEFVSAVSHDLRSPLQLIYTYASMVSESGPVNEQQQSFLEGINRSILKMSTLIDDLLDLAKIEAGVDVEVGTCDLEQVITQVLERFQGIVEEKNLSLVVDVPSDIPRVDANVRRVDQVLSNLIDNAIKYTPQGTIAVRATVDDRQATVYISDSGIGLLPQEQQEVFTRFYRARNAVTQEVEGTGLGLAIARSIVDSYGGQIWVQSTWKKGSTFAFSLPLERRG